MAQLQVGDTRDAEAELDRETQALGLATTGGTVSNTGISGLTLGGGLGWLMGKHGFACDNLLSGQCPGERRGQVSTSHGERPSGTAELHDPDRRLDVRPARAGGRTS